jgi:hypothetical protein
MVYNKEKEKMSSKVLYITKASGQKEPFVREKLERSLARSGAGQALVREIADEVQKKIASEMPTEEIYRMAFGFLRARSADHASRYSLKRALLELGPSGHPFEVFVSEILKSRGYRVEVGRVLSGFCIKHEVDIVAKKDDKHLMTEVKFHNQLGRKTDVRVALYTHARFDDLREACEKQPGHEEEIHGALLVTNTKFTTDAIRYSKCAGLQLLGWDYPAEDNLQSLIEKPKLYPITCLASLPASAKRQLINRGVVLCRDLTGGALAELRLDQGTGAKVSEELAGILA